MDQITWDLAQLLNNCQYYILIGIIFNKTSYISIIKTTSMLDSIWKINPTS